MHSFNLYMPPESFDKEPVRHNVLFLSKNELERIQAHKLWLRRDCDLAEKERAIKDQMKAKSKSMTRTWPSTLEVRFCFCFPSRKVTVSSKYVKTLFLGNHYKLL